MDKKFYFFILAPLFIIIIGGIFLWSGVKEEVDRVTPAVKFEPPENYVIKETPEGIIVENKNAGISFKVPEGWSVEKKEIGVEEWIVNVLSSDAELNESGLLIGGCGVSAWIEYDKITADITRHRIEDPERFSAEISGGYESTEISNFVALKTTIENPKWGQAVSIGIPREDKIYVFETRFLPNETGICSQAFEEFLKGISID